MKKLVMLGMVGAMVLGAQSMVFASTSGTNETIKATATVAAQKIDETKMEVIEMTETTPAEVRELTGAEKTAQKERVKEICEAIGMAYDENTTLDEVFMNLTEAQINELAEKGLIEVMLATETVPVITTENTEVVDGDIIMAVETVTATEKIQE